MYIPGVQMDKSAKPDYLATVDIDPDSPTYSQVTSRVCCKILSRACQELSKMSLKKMLLLFQSRNAGLWRFCAAC